MADQRSGEIGKIQSLFRATRNRNWGKPWSSTSSEDIAHKEKKWGILDQKNAYPFCKTAFS